ncbi:hypothetical protein BH23PLA1_BH23PLA1_04430 [soil metagenome]
MLEPRQHPALRRWPLGLLGMLALVAAFEVHLSGQREKYSTDLAESWRTKGQQVARQAKPADLLCFGDSLVAFGVLPQVLEDRIGLPSYNLALHAGHPSASEILLQRALRAGAKPKALVVDFSPHQLAKGPRDQQFRRTWAELVSLREAVALASNARDGALLGEILVGQVLPSCKTRQEVRANLFAALQGQGWSARNQMRALRRNWEVNQGAQVLPENPDYQGAFDPEDPGLFPESWKLDPVTVRHVERFLTLADSRGVPVFWLLPPISPAAQARRDAMDLEAPYDRFVNDLQGRFPGVVVVDARRSGYEVHRFVDQVHLDRQGAVILSADLAEILQRHLDDPETVPRWVALPRFRERIVDDSRIEDLEQSRLVLRGRRGVDQQGAEGALRR